MSGVVQKKVKGNGRNFSRSDPTGADCKHGVFRRALVSWRRGGNGRSDGRRKKDHTYFTSQRKLEMVFLRPAWKKVWRLAATDLSKCWL